MADEVADILPMKENSLLGDTSDERENALALLVKRAKAGDALAFDQIMIQSQHKVASLTWRILGNEEDARDATQEVFLRAYKYLSHFRQDQDFLAWLYRISINVCHDTERKRRLRKNQISSVELEKEFGTLDHLAAPNDAEEVALRGQRRALISRAIATLPEKERTVIVLRDLEGLTTEETARIMGTRLSTVRVQISSARTKIKRYCDRLIKSGSRDRP